MPEMTKRSEISDAVLDKIQGAWISDEDPQNIIDINGDNLATDYGEQPLGDEKIVIVFGLLSSVAVNSSSSRRLFAICQATIGADRKSPLTH